MRTIIHRGAGILVLAWAPLAMSASLLVDGQGTGDCTTIQAAIDAAQSGDEIAVAPGTYCESIDFLGKAIRLYSLAGAESTVIDGTGHTHVAQCLYGEGPDTVLEGFTITGGDASGYYDSCGAGLITDGSPTVTHCTFTLNVARYGGAICGPALVSHCLFVENFARDGGALWGAGPVSDSTFIGNGADMGGAIEEAMTVVNCEFIDNEECIFQADFVANCRFTENWGAAVTNASMVTNCTFIRNYSAGVLTRIDVHSTVTHCTFLNNQIGVRHGQNGVTTMANCIIWGSTDVAILGPALVTYSSIEGGWEGEGNIDVDPLFADGEGRLLPGSPCIDAGTNDPPGGLPPVDIAGNPRPADGNGDGLAVADMGAYEVPDPAQLLEKLIEAVTDLGLPQRMNDCLMAKLEAARQALALRSETNDLVAQIELLGCVDTICGWQGRLILRSDAEALIAAAQQIIDLLDNG